MIRLLTAVFLFANFHVVAETNVPNDLTDGEVARASSNRPKVLDTIAL